MKTKALALRKPNGFTLIEILVVATIIGLLAGIAAVSYSQFSKQSRDARRKADLEQIRAAVEMYRSNDASNLYPLTADVDVSCTSTSGIVGGSITYLSKNPKDPKCTTYKYYYASSVGTTYTIFTQLEITPTTACGIDPGAGFCGGTYHCNYCLGPYGQE